MRFTDLPAVGGQIDAGTFSGLTTHDGMHCAVVMLNEATGAEMTHAAASAWAESMGGQLPSRGVWLMLASALRDSLQPRWHWTDELAGRESAYIGCIGASGGCASAYVGIGHHAVAVKLIQVTA